MSFIYASVYAFDQSHISSISNLSAKIQNYQKQIDYNNLQIINFKPYYESALIGNIAPFENLKAMLEQTLHQRLIQGKETKITVFADAACCWCENKWFDESEFLEKWWQNVHDEWTKNNYHITVICPHPHVMMDQSRLNAKRKIANLHDLMVDLDIYDLNRLRNTFAHRNDTRILVVESEPHLITLYAEYLSALDFDVIVAEDGNKCQSVLKEKDFDIVVLDMHLSDNMRTSNVTNEIHRVLPNQRIILTTTNPLNRLTTVIDSLGVSKQDVLVKPFMLSNLLELIKRK